jgi:predicted dehydrogenase
MRGKKMNENYNRRSFLKISTAAVSGMALSGFTLAQDSSTKPLRIGFVGVGDRGSYHLDCALGIEGVVVPAICDIKDSYLYRAKKWVEEAGQPTPKLYGKSKTDFKRMFEQEELDVVICSTSWKWHALVCVAAMKNGKHCVSEVPIILTLDEAWEVVETSESTGKWATIGLEQALVESNYAMHLLHMIRQGVLGDIIHAENGYVHDLRLVKFDPEREPWRLQHSVDRNGNLYPDHPMSKIMTMMDINHGDRFDYLVSMSSNSVMLNKYAEDYYGENNVYAKGPMKQGDYNATLLHTAGGKMVTLNFDTNTPHPREIFRIQGTKGVFFYGRGLGAKIYLDGRSPEEHQWEDAKKYLEEYSNPFVDNYDPPPRKQAIRGHGSHAKKTPLTWYLLVKALREKKTPIFDVPDSITSSAISPLTEMSVAKKSQPVDFPDFTRGKWKTRSPITFG